jgi:8-oxo-dGTP pyrophosphatase MutT (NUDIX family)
VNRLNITENLRGSETRPCGRPELKPAAVLLPIYPDEEGVLRVCLIRRPQAMRSHAGQIAFPGGGFDAGDESLAATALRETHEELGIDPSCVEILGVLDEAWVPSGYRFTPFVGWLDQRPVLRPNPAEVAEVLQPEVGGLMLPGVFREEMLERGDQRHRMVYFDIPGGPIWGATGRVIFRFLQLACGWRREDVRPWDEPISGRLGL